MAGKGSYESTPLKLLQRYHHTTLNNFGDGETLVEAIHKRPGCYGPNPIAYLSLLARRPGLTLGDVDEALINDRSLVRATAFRGSMFLMPADDYPLYFRALHDSLSTSGMSRLRSEGIDEAELTRLADRLRTADFTMQKTESQLMALLYPGKERRPSDDVERTLLRKLCDIGVLVRTTSKGWKGNQFQYALAKHWLEGVELVVDNVEQAKLEVVRRYLRAYGPARFEDIVWWTGLAAADVRVLIEQLGREVVRFLVDGLGEGLLTMREVADSTRKGGVGVPDRILFLPLWDAYPLGWRDRTRIVDPRFASWVYDAQGNTSSIIVEEGRAIGLWQFRDGDTITLEFHIFEPYNNRLNAVRLAAEAHASELARVSGARDVRVVERALPAPLTERPVASFLWPLGKDPVFRHSDTDYDNPMDRRERTPNVLRSKFLDDERLVRPMLEEEMRKAQRAAAREKASTLDTFAEKAPKAEAAVEKVPAKAPLAPAVNAAPKPAERPAAKPAAKAAKAASTPPTPTKAPAKPTSTLPTPAKPTSTLPTPAKAPAKATSTLPAPAKAPAKPVPKAAKAPAKPQAKSAPAPSHGASAAAKGKVSAKPASAPAKSAAKAKAAKAPAKKTAPAKAAKKVTAKPAPKASAKASTKPSKPAKAGKPASKAPAKTSKPTKPARKR